MPGFGKLFGNNSIFGMSEFSGIPYVHPPTGATGRWQPPKPLNGSQIWGDGPLNAMAPGKACMQGGTSPMDEDCLFLNIATPTLALKASSKLPVMLWSESPPLLCLHDLPRVSRSTCKAAVRLQVL